MKKTDHLNDKQAARKQRRDEEKTKLPLQNMAYKDDPPAFVTVTGSKSSGKSTLIKFLVRKLCKNSIDLVNGPITCTISKDKRATFFECKSDIHQFVDTSKVSDLVIFVIDARVGLEMECFEYLNLLMTHGLPKLLFVVTHCDKKHNQDLLKKIKKRIWSEVCDGLKFFYLGLENNKYTEMEFLNLIRAIKGMKYRPLEWKCTHSHIVVDNIDDNHAYGYVRGTSLRKNTNIYVPGYGDNKIMEFEVLEDPVPIKSEGRLSAKRDLLHAPMSIYVEEDIEESTKSSTDFDINTTDNIRLFKDSNRVEEPVISEDSSTTEDECPLESTIKVEGAEIVQDEEEEQPQDFESLKDLVKAKFRKTAENEAEWVEKFEAKYTETKTKDEENELIKRKKEIMALKEKNLENKIADIAYPGEYIKISLKEKLLIPRDFTSIIILGVLNAAENTEVILQGKVKKSKWHKKLLKTNEPYLFSLGWRRFQSIPVFSSKTPDINRMLKYSFQHGYCGINFYGFTVQPGTGFAIYSEKGDFRILAGGNVLDVTGNHNLVKKLKLLGYPKTITGNTVIVKNMFTSDLEVLKFKYAKLKTASGLKGTIKNPIGKNGDFRGYFEGEMLMSDIITLRCYVNAPIYKFNLNINNAVKEWKGLRSLKEIRDELGIELKDRNNEIEESSEAKSLESEEREEFKLPVEVENELPIDQRTFKTIDETIKLPTPPGSRNIVDQLNELQRLRKEKDKADRRREELAAKAKEKEYEEYLKDKQEKKKKRIIESALDRQKKYKGFKANKK